MAQGRWMGRRRVQEHADDEKQLTLSRPDLTHSPEKYKTHLQAAMAPAYGPGTLEGQMRALADLAFMLQDYDTCASTLRLLGPELKADKAWKHYAGCQVGAGGVDDHGSVLTSAQVQADTCYADWYPRQA